MKAQSGPVFASNLRNARDGLQAHFDVIRKFVSRSNATEIAMIFNSLDVTGDGKLAADDFRSAMTHVHSILEGIWKYLKSTFDENKDNVISKKEFFEGFVMIAFSKAFLPLSGERRFHETFAHMIRCFNAELAAQISHFRQRTGIKHILAYSDTARGVTICPICFALNPARYAALEKVEEGTRGFDAQATDCSNCFTNFGSLREQLLPDCDPVEIPTDPSIPQKALLTLAPVHMQVFLPNIKLLLTDRNGDCILEVFKSLDVHGNGFLSPITENWNLLEHNFDFNKDEVVEPWEFTDGFILHSYLEVDNGHGRLANAHLSDEFLGWVSRFNSTVTLQLVNFQKATIVSEESSAHPQKDEEPVTSRRSLEHRVETTPEERRVFANYFRDIDRDGDDELTAYELKLGLQNLGFTGITESIVRRMMREADKNEDGVVDFDEFCQICKKMVGLSPEWARVQKRVIAEFRTETERQQTNVAFETFNVGDKCWYKNIITCTVIEKFTDDYPPYFNVRLEGGKVRQTIAQNLVLIGQSLGGQYEAGDRCIYRDSAACVIVKKYTDTDSACFYDIELENGEIRQTIPTFLQRANDNEGRSTKSRRI